MLRKGGCLVTAAFSLCILIVVELELVIRENCKMTHFEYGQISVNQDRQNDAAKKRGGVPVSPSNGGGRSSPRAESESAIGAGLRSLYEEVVLEPLPDDIMALLDKLESTDSDDE